MSHAVFISHASKEKPIADAICAALEAQGLRCWIAPRDIPVGESWASSISQGITGCRVMVLILSPLSAASKEVAREVNQADSEKKAIVPFWIQDVTLVRPLDYYLRNVYRVDARSPALDEHMLTLIHSVRHYLRSVPPPLAGRGMTPAIPLYAQEEQPIRLLPPVRPSGATAPIASTVLRTSILAAVTSAGFAVFGSNACAAYMLTAPLIAAIWLSIVSFRSRAPGQTSRALLRLGLGLLAFLLTAFFAGLTVGIVVEFVKAGGITTPTSRPSTAPAGY